MRSVRLALVGALGPLVLLLGLSLGPAEAAPAAIGDPAPGFRLDSQRQPPGPVDLGTFRGKVVMLNFWASWCVPCRAEMPLLNALYAKERPHGFVLLGISLDADPADAKAALARTTVSFPILFDADNTTAGKYGIVGMPSTALIDRKGRLRWLHSGYKPGDETEYRRQIQRLLVEPG